MKIIAADLWKIIFSTGLLILEPTTVNMADTPMSILSDFDVASFGLSKVTAEPLNRYYGIQVRGLPYPSGSTDDGVVPFFKPRASALDNFTYSANIQGVHFDLDCEVVYPSNTTYASLPWLYINSEILTVNISTESCHLTYVAVAAGLQHNPDHADATQQYQGWWGNYTCNDGVASDTWPPGERPIKPGFTDHRLVMTTSDVRWHALYTGIWVEKMTTIMCKPSYGLDMYDVSFPFGLRGAKQPLTVTKTSNDSSQISGLSNAMLIPALRDSATQASFGNAGQVLPEFALTNDPLFQMMAIMNGSPGNFKPFMDPAKLLTFAPKVFKGAMAQIFYDFVLSPTNRTLSGSVSYTENRLQVKGLTVGFMATLMVILACISLLESFLRPQNVVSCDPQSLSAAAAVTASSKRLQTLLSVIGRSSAQDLRKQLSTHLYRSTIEAETFVVDTTGAKTDDGRTPRRAIYSKNEEWWRPLAVRLPFRILTIALPLIIIGILEALQQLSNSRHGLFDVPDTDSKKHVLMHYVPALVLLGIVALYSSLHFAMAVFAPFFMLRRGNAIAARSMNVNIIGKTYLHAFIISVHAKYGPACFAIAAGFLATFLTIIVSGLYSVESAPLNENFTLQRLDHFNFSLGNLIEDDNLAAGVANLIVNQNLSYPQWTYDELVFPHLGLSHRLASTPQGSSITVSIPAVRPSLNCTIFSPSQIKYVGMVTGNMYFATLNFGAHSPWPCHLYNATSNGDQELNPDGQFGLYLNNTQHYVGMGFPLGGWNARPPGYSEMTDVTYFAGCPTIMYALGTASAWRTPGENGTTDARGQIYMFDCYQHLQEVMTNVTFKLPKFELDPSIPPSPSESTAQYIKIRSANYTGPIFATNIMTFLSGLTNYGLAFPAPANSGDSNGNWMTKDGDYLDPFIQALIRGKDGIPLKELVGMDNVPRLMKAANHLYATYMVQAIDANYRVPGVESLSSHGVSAQPTSGTEVTFNGTLNCPSRQRIKQSFPVKCTLQAILGVMTLCAIIVYVISDTKEVLPQCPCSIAGTMSLLAGGELLSGGIIPTGSEWKTDKERNGEIWEGYVFSLGWWGGRYGIDIGNAGKGPPAYQGF
jgi:hypothetical protein